MENSLAAIAANHSGLMADQILQAQNAYEATAKISIEPIVALHARKFDLPIKVAEEHADEMRRYLALCSIEGTGGYGMAGPVDEIWHELITDTKRYNAVCQAMGTDMIPHVPAPKDKHGLPQLAEQDTARYPKFLQHYEEAFAKVPPGHVWPKMIAGGDNVGDASCNDTCGCGPACGDGEALS